MSLSVRIIGISGKAQSGKDTFGEMLAEEFYGRGYDVRVVRFADKLKEVCTDLFMFPSGVYHVDSDKNSPQPPSGCVPRKVLQLLGTDFGRKLWPHIWVIHTVKKIDSIVDEMKKDTIIIVPDVRFENELNALMSDYLIAYLSYRDWVTIDSIAVRMERPGVKIMSHPSEWGLDRVVPFPRELSWYALKQLWYAIKTRFKPREFDYTVIENDGTLDELRMKARTMVKNVLLSDKKEEVL